MLRFIMIPNVTGGLARYVVGSNSISMAYRPPRRRSRIYLFWPPTTTLGMNLSHSYSSNRPRCLNPASDQIPNLGSVPLRSDEHILSHPAIQLLTAFGWHRIEPRLCYYCRHCSIYIPSAGILGRDRASLLISTGMIDGYRRSNASVAYLLTV